MDAKALAKSKRAHSQHHSKKSHSGHKPKVLPESSGSVRNLKKLQGNKAAAESAKNPSQSTGLSALPSNWDRYDEEFDLGLDSASGNLPAQQHIDIIIPKSKGADYRHLISEAEAESQSKMSITSDGLSSLDDVLHDEFSWVVGSILSARGEGIRSWIEDDNFIVEDGTLSSHEPAFLSLNLNALAEKLEKVDLHEALYVDADILPPELCMARPKVSGNQGKSRPQTTRETKAVTSVLDEPVQRDLNRNDKGESLETIAPGGDLEDDYLSPVPETHTVDQVKDIPIIAGQSQKPYVDSKSSAFEDELDVLLNSFGETSIQEARNNPLHSVGNSAFFTGSSDQKLQKATTNDVFEKSSTFEGTSAEAELDTLLNSYGAASLQESYDKPNQLPSSAKDTSPSDPTLHKGNLDDVLDDLLEQTSGTVKQQQNQTTASSSSVGKSKVLDEFDSWLDTI